MRFKAVNMRLALSSLLAVLALGAVAASAAQAATAEGPFYKIGTTRLASGKSQEVKIKQSEGIYLYLEAGETLKCNSAKLAPGAKLLGSTGANFGGGEVTLEFSECNAKSGSESGPPEHEPLKTAPLKLELGFENGKRTGEMQIVFKPVKGSLFLEGFNIQRAISRFPPIDGSLPTWIRSNGKPVEVGHEPAAALTLGLSEAGFDTRDVWLETNGSLAEQKVGLTSDSGVEELFSPILELTSGGTWGVFTK